MFPFSSNSRLAVALFLLGASPAIAAQTNGAPAPETVVSPQLAAPGTQLGAIAAKMPAEAAAPQFSIPPPEPKPQMADGEQLLALMHTQKVCETPLDLKVDGATLEDIAARVHEMLPAPAATIEVRGTRPVRLSFALQKSTVGEALSTAATVGGAQLWVFPNRLLLAPEKALSKEEQATLKQYKVGASGIGDNTPNASIVSFTEVRRVFSNLISDEVKAFPSAAPANAAPVVGQEPAPLAKTTFSMLSPQAKEMLQQLVGQWNESNDIANIQRQKAGKQNDWREPPSLPAFKLSPDSVVQLVPGGPLPDGSLADTSLKVESPTDSQGWTLKIGWTLSGNGFSTSANQSSMPTPSKPSPPPFLDPSAGKS